MKLRFLLKRFAFIALLATAVIVGGVLLPALAGAAQGTVRIDSAQAGVGQKADITLSARAVGAPGIGAWTIDVNYDPATVSVVECQAEQGGLCNEAFAEGVVRVAGISLAGLVGDSDLAGISFRCEQAGVSLLGVSIDVFSDASLGDPQQIEASVLTGTLICSEEPPTATPMPTAAPTPTDVPAEPPASEPDKVPGDADCDEDVDSIDAAHVLQFEARLLAEIACLDNADANHDGRVGPIDAAIILQTSAGLLG